MSNLFPDALRAIAACALLAAVPFAASAQPSPAPAPQLSVGESIDAVARFMIESTQAKGPTVPYPDDVRPQLPVALCSIERPLCIRSAHPNASSAELLRALEDGYDWLRGHGWPVPIPDGGAGGTLEIDVYALPAEGRARAADGGVDELLPVTPLDGATSFARLDPQVPRAQRFACAVQALADAGLRGADPAERSSATAPLAAFAAYLATGSFGCANAIDEAQAQPELGFGDEDDPRISDTQMLLALVLVSRRHDGGSGQFVREAFQLARQKSPERARLRATPAFYEALDRALRNAGESLELIAEELAIARYFSGERAAYGLALPALAQPVPVVQAAPYPKLPSHLPDHMPLLRPFGSAYARVDTRDAPPGSQLQVWMRADLGPRLALTAVRLDGSGREIGRMSAPARRVPQSFLPVELSSDTAAVLVVVTSLPHELRAFARDQPYEPARIEHGFRLILDKR